MNRQEKKAAIRLEQRNRYLSENYIPNKPKQLTSKWRYELGKWTYLNKAGKRVQFIFKKSEVTQ